MRTVRTWADDPVPGTLGDAVALVVTDASHPFLARPSAPVEGGEPPVLTAGHAGCRRPDSSGARDPAGAPPHASGSRVTVVAASVPPRRRAVD